MKYYLIDITEIDECSKNGIVACWSDDHNCAIVEVNEQSKLIFDGYEIVEICEETENEGEVQI